MHRNATLRAPAVSMVVAPRTLAERIRAALLVAGQTALAAELAEYMRTRPVARFAWIGPQSFEVDGHPIRARGKGLPLAFLVLAGHRHRLGEHLAASAVFQGRASTARALQALDRAAEAVRPHAPAVAGCIAALGVERGHLVVKRPLPATLELSAPALAAVALR